MIDVNINAAGTGSFGGGNEIWLDPNQIESFINGAVNIDNRTMGWGMTFFHESFHTTIGGGLSDKPGDPGPVVNRMNKIRRELNAQGGNFGQRQTYDHFSVTGGGGIRYLPFASATLPLIGPVNQFVYF